MRAGPQYRSGVADVIPVFPLSHVLLPGLPLPLHIFEPRYRQLLCDVRTDKSAGSFGVLALRHGSEAGPCERPDVADVGTLAEIVEVEAGDDGTSDLLTIGSRRFQVDELLDGAPYLRARVTWLDEQDGDLRPSQLVVARRLFADMSALLGELTGRERSDDLPQDATLLSYHLAGHLPISAPDRQALLAEPTTAARLHRLISTLRREIQLLQATSSVAIAPSVLRLVAHPN